MSIPLRTKELGTIESESKTIEEVKTVTEPFLILEENCAKEVKMIKKRSKKIKNLFFVTLCVLFVFMLFACGTTHKVSKTWEVDAENHWHTCADCDELFDKGAHDMQFVESKEASCTEDGYELYKCSVCGYTRKDVIVATGHVLEKHNAVDGDCVTSGATEYYSCSKCNKFYSDIQGKNEIAENSWIIPCAGHTISHVEGKPATYTESGIKEHYYCSVCKKYYEDAACTIEITDGVFLEKLVCSVSEARNLAESSEIVVRGVVAGITTTQSSLNIVTVSYTHLRAHETVLDLVCRLMLEKKNKTDTKRKIESNQRQSCILHPL